jgi:transposase
VRAKRGLPDRPNPTDRGKPRSKDHLLTDRCGIPLAVGLSAANTHYSVLEAMVDAVPAIRGPRGRPGRPRKRPARPSRCVVERSLAWLVGYRRLQVRYERRADVLLGSTAWPAR